MNRSELLHWSPEARAARAAGLPLVALETTVLAHGLPYPRNVACARAMLDAVREGGAAPVLIGVVDGRVHLGLDADTVERFARGHDIAKASARDVGPLVAAGRSGATTVAGTVACAAAAEIAVFATGGIGGVHPGYSEHHDVSADLAALARYPVLTISSGAKSILDLPRTVEELERLGVPVLGFRTDSLPAFYVPNSDLPVSARVDSADEAARAHSAHVALTDGGSLLVQAIPDAAALDACALDDWIASAEREAREAGVRGAAVTPYLLARLHELSEGATLEANVALLVANAELAARVAVALADA